MSARSTSHQKSPSHYQTHVIHIPTDPSLLADPRLPLIHRDLSWLQFNERVLAEARTSAGNPLLERIKFLAISSSNLDEFFMVRVSSLDRSISSSKDDHHKNFRLTKVKDSILNAVSKFTIKQAETLELLSAELVTYKINIVRAATLDSQEFQLGRQIFANEIMPKLEPPEPFSPTLLSNLENLQLGVLCGKQFWFKIPKSLPTTYLITLPNGSHYFFFLDDLLATHLGSVLPHSSPYVIFRLTRDSDFTIDFDDQDTESVPDVVRTGLRIRERGKPVRLQHVGRLSPAFLREIAKSLKLQPADFFEVTSTLNLNNLWSLVSALPQSLSQSSVLNYPSLRACIPEPFRGGSKIFDQLKQRDLLLHHPYDSFDAYIAWIQAACDDPNVIMIEQTAYRMDALSPLIEAFKSAAKKKKVRLIIELRARFDEFNNLKLADELQKAGVEVGFGFGKLKLHAKVALVTRNEGNLIRQYTHLSTGNYKATTARQYTDLAIITSNQEIGLDARHFFDSVWQEQIPTSFRKLVPAPSKLHRRLLQLIRSERQAALQGQKARIVAKVNALVDDAVVQELYEASQAGVKVDLIVRGACSLIPGVNGLSENIRVVSVVDRFLEHSRLYYFENSRAMYLSSADWMPRNFFSRLELAFPILDPRLYEYLRDIVIPTYLSDNVKAKELTHQGYWKRRHRKAGSSLVRSQFAFEELANRQYRGTPLERIQCLGSETNDAKEAIPKEEITS